MRFHPDKPKDCKFSTRMPIDTTAQPVMLGVAGVRTQSSYVALELVEASDIEAWVSREASVQLHRDGEHSIVLHEVVHMFGTILVLCFMAFLVCVAELCKDSCWLIGLCVLCFQLFLMHIWVLQYYQHGSLTKCLNACTLSS